MDDTLAEEDGGKHPYDRDFYEVNDSANMKHKWGPDFDYCETYKIEIIDLKIRNGLHKNNKENIFATHPKKLKVEAIFEDYLWDPKIKGLATIQKYPPMKQCVFMHTFNLYMYPDEWENFVRMFTEGFGSSPISIISDDIYDFLDDTMWQWIEIHAK